MIIKVYLKDPDGFYEGVQEAVTASLKGMNLSKAESEMLIEKRGETAFEALTKWVEDGEYVEILFDLDAGTATVTTRK